MVFTLLLPAAMSGYATVPDRPAMQKARSNLQAARAELRSAKHNKGGHRGKAIEYVDTALVQVNAGIEYDRRHNHAQSVTDLLAGLAAPDQPHMRAALINLQTARDNLDQANPDKGGHRVKAIELVKKAIEEVNAGIAAGA